MNHVELYNKPDLAKSIIGLCVIEVHFFIEGQGGHGMVKVKDKGLSTCYSAAYETRTAAIYNLRSGS